MAGLGAAAALADLSPVIYEQRATVGGHASAHHVDAFTFDEGPHISFTKDERVRALFARAVDGRFHEREAVVLNYYRGCVFKHPGTFHLHPLPDDIKIRCLVDLVEARRDGGAVETYLDWCYRQFGRSYTEIFVREYTRKYWTVPPEELTADWVAARITTPSIAQAIEGAFRDTAVGHNYITTFRYPQQGGFAAFLRDLAAGCTIQTNQNVRTVDPRSRTLTFADGRGEPYDWLISSLPLPDIVAALPAPPSVREAAGRLRCTSHFLVNVGIRGTCPIEADWIYFYDEDLPFARVSVPSRFAPANAPAGHYSLQAEVAHSTTRPLGDAQAVTDRTVEGLIRVGLVRGRDDIVLVHRHDIRYANVMFTKGRAAAVDEIHAYLTQVGIVPCGRYGLWAYLWTDESYLSGVRAGETVRGRITAGAAAP